MKTQLLKATILGAISTSLIACGNSSKSGAKSSGQPQETELTGKPLTAEQMAAQTYRLKTDKQEFVLTKLGHLVWAKFNCKAELNSGENLKTANLQISFYPQFEILTKSEGKTDVLVSPDEVCGSKLSLAGTQVLPIGSLEKDQNNQYNINYQVGATEPTSISLKWDAARTNPGELICTNKEGKMAKAVLKDCELIPLETQSEASTTTETTVSAN